MFCFYFLINIGRSFTEFWNSGLEICQTAVRVSKTFFVDSNKERNKNVQYLQRLPQNTMLWFQEGFMNALKRKDKWKLITLIA